MRCVRQRLLSASNPTKRAVSSAARARSGFGGSPTRHKALKIAKPRYKALKKITVNILWQMTAVKAFTVTVYHKMAMLILFTILWAISQRLVRLRPESGCPYDDSSSSSRPDRAGRHSVGQREPTGYRRAGFCANRRTVSHA